MDERFKLNTLKCYIVYLLDKKGWEYNVEMDAHINFILGNREIFTRELNIEQLEEVINTISGW